MRNTILIIMRYKLLFLFLLTFGVMQGQLISPMANRTIYFPHAVIRNRAIIDSISKQIRLTKMESKALRKKKFIHLKIYNWHDSIDYDFIYLKEPLTKVSSTDTTPKVLTAYLMEVPTRFKPCVKYKDGYTYQFLFKMPTLYYTGKTKFKYYGPTLWIEPDAWLWIFLIKNGKIEFIKKIFEDGCH